MKKCFITLFLMVFACFSLQAQTANKASQKTFANTASNAALTNAQNSTADGKNADNMLVAYKTIGVTNNYMDGRRMGYGTINPITYDPVAKALVMVQNAFQLQGTTLIQPVNTIFYLGVSFNNGVNWTFKGVDTVEKTWAILPSLGILNYKGTPTTNATEYLNNLTYRITAVNGGYNASDQLYYFNKGLVNFVHTSDAEGDLINFGPKTTNYYWWTNQMAVSNNIDKPYIATAGIVNPISESYKLGNYGVSVFDPVSIDIYEKMPAEWALSNFRDYTEDNRHYYSSSVYLDTDPDGTLYAAFNNFVAPNEQDRLITISKSEDMGKTWTPSPFDQMPKSLLDQYVVDNGGTLDSLFYFYPFDQEAFVVTGVDEFSYFTQFYFSKVQDQDSRQGHLVEIYKKGGSWGMRGVAAFSMLSNVVILNVSQDNNTIKDSLAANNLGYEIQAAKTADGKNIVLKWIDVVDKKVTFPAPVTLLNSAPVTTLEEWYSNDIFLAKRAIDSEQWEVKNATDDNTYKIVTFIPKIVPDLENVPLLNYQPRKPSAQNPRSAYPEMIQQMAVDMVPDISFKNFSFATGVEDNIKNDARTFVLNNAIPNPASAVAEISFVLDTPAFAKVEVFDALGQKVATLQNGELPSGFHATNFNTLGLTSGVYYYTLTVGGKSMTRTMTVVH